MIVYEGPGDIFRSPAQTLVCPVNTKGVMGNGLALAFSQRFPGLLEVYKEYCQSGQFKVNSLLLLNRVLCFPTKDDFRYASRLEWIDANLAKLAATYMQHDIQSLAVPGLGCGKGQLSLSEVGPLVYQHLDPLPIDVYFYTSRAPHMR